MDRIFVMKDGQISEQGNYHELLAAGGEFADFLVQYLTDEQVRFISRNFQIEIAPRILNIFRGKIQSMTWIQIFYNIFSSFFCKQHF